MAGRKSSPICLCGTKVHHSDGDFLNHVEQLDQNLRDYGFQRDPVKGDGNCLFYALAQGLIYEARKDPNSFGNHLRQFHLSADFHLGHFAKRLREICIEQWRTNEPFYNQFVPIPQVKFRKEVHKFSKTGVCDSALGDIVPLTISNALRIQIVIFTSVSNLSRIDIKPTDESISSLRSLKLIFLAYNQYGRGHYDAAYSLST